MVKFGARSLKIVEELPGRRAEACVERRAVPVVKQDVGECMQVSLQRMLLEVRRLWSILYHLQRQLTIFCCSQWFLRFPVVALYLVRSGESLYSN